MAGKRRAELGRRRFIRLAGGTAAGAAVVGGGAFTAMATGVFESPTTDPFANMPRSIALSLPTGTSPEPTPLTPLPDPLDGATVTAPSPSVRIPYTGGTPDPTETDVPTSLPFEFNRSGYAIDPELPEAMRPWRDRPTSYATATATSGTYRPNAQGVWMYYAPDGKVYDHIVGQAQFGLGCISSYRTATDPDRKAFFLRRARAQADRLIARRVETRGAWYFPYAFNLNHDHGFSYKAPWYSGMAQGEVLGLFSQLAGLQEDLTADERALYRAAADGTFASLLRADNARPWVINKDRSGYLWIQEYPFSTPGTGDYTYNGMIYALFGVWDYHMLTGNELAAQLYDGVCTTVARYFSLLRNPRWYSFYCQTHRIPANTYHQHHIELWTQLHEQTKGAVFANQLDQLMEDFPAPGVKAGSVIAIAGGTHTLYKVDTAANGTWVKAKADKILASKKVTFARATQAPIDMRRRIQGAGVWYRISAGAYKGYWIGEAYPKVFLRGEHLPVDYRTERKATVAARTSVEAIDFGTNGVAGTLKKVSYDEPHTLTFDRRAVVNGRSMIRITSAELAGYWVPANQVTTDGR
ncbi:D-glucuronyl C5-epimerase family protein [Streptomyces longwoodensis]|uniref:D-glucuronyl C5-epimerase family protein n=1 Tax=Streptomyces longwoodensis TaxID=68231 RepID=UPI003850E83B